MNPQSVSAKKSGENARGWLRAFCAMVATGVASGILTGCVAVGYTSGGGWFLWPGGLGLLFVILFVLFLLRRRR